MYAGAMIVCMLGMTWLFFCVSELHDVPQDVNDCIDGAVTNTEGLHSLLRGMLAPPELRWTLSKVKQHLFFTTNLPDGALNLSDKVAAADVGGEPETQRVFRSLQHLMSCCGEPPQSPLVPTDAAHALSEPVCAVPVSYTHLTLPTKA